MTPLLKNTIGIRLEDKNKWERRVPLTPGQVEDLIRWDNIHFIVQPSPIRAFDNGDYIQAGALVQDDLASADIILAVKEVPLDLLQPGKTYVFFSHTIKGQPHNMPLLQRLLDLKCQLIDYERIVDNNKRRLIAFGRHAGLAGMIDTLHTLGQRLAWEGVKTPLADIQLTHNYDHLAAAQQAIRAVGRRIAERGLPVSISPLVIGIAGYGNVSRGAQEILDWLPVQPIEPQQLLSLSNEADLERNMIYKVIFKEFNTVKPLDEGRRFDLQEFFEQPERYVSQFDQYLPHLTTLVNCIYWDTPYPRLLTKEAARNLYRPGRPPKLRVIGDISCDIEGGIEITVKPTSPDEPAFVWDPATDRITAGVAGYGPVIMAIDNLPCELPLDSSTDFGNGLRPFVPALANCDFSRDFESCGLPPELRRATIVYHGRLTPQYNYLEQFLPKRS